MTNPDHGGGSSRGASKFVSERFVEELCHGDCIMSWGSHLSGTIPDQAIASVSRKAETSSLTW